MADQLQQEELIKAIEKNEQKSRFRLFSWSFLSVILAGIVIFLGITAQNQKEEIQSQNEQLEQKRESLAQANAELEELNHELEEQRNAFNSSREAIYKRNMDLKGLLMQTYDNVRSRSLQRQIKEALKQENEISGSIVYITYKGEKDQQLAEDLRNGLKEHGYYVTPLGKNANEESSSRIFYFRDSDKMVANMLYDEVCAIIRKTKPEFDFDNGGPVKLDNDAPSKKLDIWINIE